MHRTFRTGLANQMKTMGLTGGIGMGKSTTADLLVHRGLEVVDTDLLARELVEPGQPALLEIAEAFGGEMIGPEGRLDREGLARLAFGDEPSRRRLEQILHPRIRERWQARVRECRQAGKAVAVVIPLLFETQAQSAFDLVVCVGCSAATQRARLLARGWTTVQIEQRLGAQWPSERKMELSDYVIWTESGPALHQAQLDRVLVRAGLGSARAPSRR